jgi:hypothetical protein
MPTTAPERRRGEPPGSTAPPVSYVPTIIATCPHQRPGELTVGILYAERARR